MALENRLVPLLIASALAGVLATAVELWPRQPHENPQVFETRNEPLRPIR